MKSFKIGDKVQLINGNLKGVVLAVFEYRLLMKDEFGFEEEVLISNVTFQSNEADYEMSLNTINIVVEKKETAQAEKESKANIIKEVLEVDLHIHHLTSSTRNMTNHDMVMLQLKKVKDTIRLVNRNRHSKIVFIHGVGSGKLRIELEMELLRNNIKFQDASFERYGRGALEVLLF